MNAARGSAVALAGAAAALVLLGACTPSTPQQDASKSKTVQPSTPSASATEETPTAEPSEASGTASEPTDAASLPPGFPDPASLIGGDLTTTFTDTGSTTLVNGEDIGLVDVFGACFGGTGDHVCDWSIQGSAQVGEGGIPEPTEVSLLMLLRNAGMNPDGSAIWSVVDAIATFAPGGQPALLQYCQGEDGVAFYPDPAAAAGATIPAAAAWGANADMTSLVSIDPAGLSCEAFGD
ncbi:MAG: hypothetical protein KQH57_09345 [Actinomycetales bacterium]|nr:hypothetical protein [Actinomycetales bacterium]